MGSLQEQQFTFSSPISETYDDAVDFDYDAWIEQSKSSYYASQDEKSYAGSLDGEALKKHYREMVLQAAQGMPENVYELSLRDLTELPRVGNATQETGEKGRPSKSWRKRLPRSESVEGAGRLLKMFLPSPSGGRKKSFSISASPAVPSKSASENGQGPMKHTSAEMAREIDNRRSNSMPSKGNKDSSYNRKSMGCYPFFNTNKHKVKRITGGQYCL